MIRDLASLILFAQLSLSHVTIYPMAPNMVKPGIYEQIVFRDLALAIINESNFRAIKGKIDPIEASTILSNHLSFVLEKGLSSQYYEDDLDKQIRLVNELVDIIAHETSDPFFLGLHIEPEAEQLLALIDKKNNLYSINEKAEVPRPSSIAFSSLFTGAAHEPSMVTELKKEIASCDCIDILMSFIKWSGLRLIMDELTDFTQRGGRVRVITTSYMGATDVKAIDMLSRLANTYIKVSYDTKRTRLHAKAYVFSRDSGFSTAYIGSSNLSNAAISSGLEWNVKITAHDMPDIMHKVTASFESYWNSSEFEAIDANGIDRLSIALRDERMRGSVSPSTFFDIAPYPFQQEILDKMMAERLIRQSYKNLIVAATGTGKTVISALDYKRFCQANTGMSNKLLFVAHREEILKQSLACFQGVLKNQNFGDLFVGNYRPECLDHLFISIQTFQSQRLDEKTTPDNYDFIIVDEFHHAAAPTYQRMLEYYKPKILLGLTATPERMDGKSILHYFGGRIAAEVRLPEAIERKLLCPFHYFGVTDTVDLSKVKWTRGIYDRGELSEIYTSNLIVAERRADMIVRSITKYVTDIDQVKGLGFCVSVDHAKFMAQHLNKWGISSISLTAESTDEERNSAKQRLFNGDIKIIFVVDLYNEGVDIPEVNTVLFLRPTESLTIFLQQLGRGLRPSEGKECLTVLDFIGQANKKYRFEEKFAALMSNSRKSVEKEIKDGFVSLPKGCYIQLERKSKDIILENIRSAIGLKSGLISKIISFEEESGLPLTLTNFLTFHNLDIRRVYSQNTFSRLCALANVIPNFSEPDEDLLKKAFQRICSIDSRRFITFLLHTLPDLDDIQEITLNAIERRMLQMFHFTIWQKPVEELGFANMVDGLRQLKRNPILYQELQDILKFALDRIDFIDHNNDLSFDCPLDLYCTYSRDQIMVAMDFLKPSTVREGVKHLPDKKVDVLLITLNKSDKDYSPTTMYNDYSINEWLFHWQSQSTTSDDSPTGLRYINHQKLGYQILLFVRDGKKDNLGNTEGYTFLGTADYQQHKGSRPMSIVWKLHQPIPARFLKKTNQMMAD